MWIKIIITENYDKGCSVSLWDRSFENIMGFNFHILLTSYNELVTNFFPSFLFVHIFLLFYISVHTNMHIDIYRFNCTMSKTTLIIILSQEIESLSLNRCIIWLKYCLTSLELTVKML